MTLSRWCKSALPLTLIVIVGATPPPVVRIEVVPTSVFVEHKSGTTSFTLEARLWTSEPGVPGERKSIISGYPLSWTTSQSWLRVTPLPGLLAQFTIDQPVQGSASVTVSAGSQTSLPATIVVAPGPTPGEDYLTAKYAADMAPQVAVTGGVRGTLGGPCGVTFSAFVTGARLGDLVAPCTTADAGWEAAVLSTDNRLAFGSGSWGQPQNIVSAGSLQQPRRTIPIAIRVVVGDNTLSTDALEQRRKEVMNFALADVEAANGVLDTTRAGIKLGIPDTATITSLGGLANPGTGQVKVTDCLGGDDLIPHDADGMVNVYYVNELQGSRGFTCTWQRWRKYPAIFIQRDKGLQTTFVHELGHALGLTVPEDGHTDIVGGTDISNVMTSGYYDRDDGGRRRFTVGQVFRMNADSASWLNWAEDPAGTLVREPWAPRVACQCGMADPAGRCPPMAADLAPPSAAVDKADAWDCVDRLRIRKAPSTEQPVAIIAGRGWRSPPEKCSPYLPGWQANHWGAVYIAFDNLTRPGDCPSSARIFFRRHRAKYIPLAEPGYRLTAVAEDVPVPELLAKPFPVHVRVFRPAGSQVLVGDNIDYATTVFGPLNRAGITLLFDVMIASCPSAGPKYGEIQVCFLTGLTGEGTLVGPNNIEIRKATASTLAHLIGQALGLDVGDPDITGNLMQHDPMVRGKKLTLGQVDRINVKLGILPVCIPSECPPVDMDVTP
jgi:hypothetical protein